MKVRLSLIVTFLLLGLSVAMIVPPSAAQPAAQPLYGGVLIAHALDDPPNLNPSLTPTHAVHRVAGLIFDSLVNVDGQGVPHPELAQSWEISQDGLTYTFHLIRNATWQDGVPFTSADVKFDFEQVLEPFNSNGGMLKSVIQSIEAPDNYTVVFNLTKPTAAFVNWYLAFNNAAIGAAKHLYENTDILNNPYNLKPVGTGPFMFVSWVRGAYIILKRNPNYWKAGLPYLDGVTFKIIPDISAAVLALQTGEVNMLQWDPPLLDIARLGTLPGIKAEIGLSAIASQDLLGFNLRRPLMSNLAVRQAIAYAIDRAEINKDAFFGLGQIAYSPLGKAPFTMWAYNNDTEKMYPHDLDMANKLLDGAGYPMQANGTRFQVSLVYSPDWTPEGDVASILATQLSKVGVSVNLVSLSSSPFQQRIFASGNYPDFDMAILPYNGGPDPLELDLKYRSDPPPNAPVTWGNVFGYANATVDKLLDQGSAEINRTKRGEDYKQVQMIIMQDLPVFPMTADLYGAAWTTDFVGLHFLPWLRENLDWVYWTGGTPALGVSTTTATTAVSVSTIPSEAFLAIAVIVVAIAIYAVMRRRAVKKPS